MLLVDDPARSALCLTSLAPLVRWCARPYGTAGLLDWI